jgi:hypothetical protein
MWACCYFRESTFFSALGRSFFDDAASTETQAHRSNGPYQRISLGHLLCSATICSTPMQGMRSWDRVYCCPTAAKPPVERAGHSTFLRYLQVKRRADERTRTADLLITRKNRYISGCMRLLQNPLGKPNTRTSNILEQPEIRPGWCTIGVRGPHFWRPRSASLGPGDAVGPFVGRDFLELAVNCGDEGAEVLVAEGFGYKYTAWVGTARFDQAGQEREEVGDVGGDKHAVLGDGEF